MSKPRLIQTYLPDGTLEGIRVVEVSESAIKAFVVPRIKLNDLKDRKEINQPALYLLVNSGENQVYIGESENFFHRIKNHDQSKDFWDLAIAVVSNTNDLEKSHIKYLESLAVEKAKNTAAMTVLNKTVPIRNNVHEFKLHSLQMILEDIALISESLGFSVFASQQGTEPQNEWHLDAKNTHAKAEYRGNKIIVLAGSKIDPSYSERWAGKYAAWFIERNKILEESTDLIDGVYVLNQNIPFNSPSRAAVFCVGRNANGWTEWRNSSGQTMDEVIRKGSA